MPARSESRVVHVQAHRGASALAMENTMAAFLRAVEEGADSLELDVVVTKDGQLAIFHDFEIGPDTVKRYDGKPVTEKRHIADLTLAELREYYVDAPKRLKDTNTLTPRQREIPTLPEVFAAIRASRHPNASRIIVDVELKSEPDRPQDSPAPKAFAASIVSAIDASAMKPQVAVRSFDHRTLKALREIDPKIPIAALTEVGHVGFDGNYDKVIAELRPEVLAPYVKDVTPALVEAWHKAGVKVMPWTANAQAQWDEMLAAGVDGLTTDNPKALAEYLAARKYARPQEASAIYRCPGAYRRLK